MDLRNEEEEVEFARGYRGVGRFGVGSNLKAKFFNSLVGLIQIHDGPHAIPCPESNPRSHQGHLNEKWIKI